MERRDLLKLVPATSGLALAAGRAALAWPGADAEPPVPPPPDLGWWREARFGMFVHWGPVSLKRHGDRLVARQPRCPRRSTTQLYRRFNPTRFDARAWARPPRQPG